MIEIINTKSDNDGRVLVHIHKEPYDVTDKVKDGEASLNIYGKEYKVHVQDGKDINGVSKARRFKKTRK
jgi:hypothetical protein